MSQPFVGEIRIVGFNFAPRSWAFCDGQILPISQNGVLFNLIGTTYGGDGVTNFALPDLRGRAPLHIGQSPGTSNYVIGQSGGAESVTVTVGQMPAHVHSAIAQAGGADVASPAGAIPASGGPDLYATAAGSGGAMSLANAGGSQPHDNMKPFLAMNFVICLFGIFPSRN